MLVERYAFAKSKVTLLLDKRATRASIMDHYLSYAGLGTKADDRLVVFFAGHGHTAKSRRGNVGFLVPIDGDTARLSSLIRWDELTKGADLISAKHILFLMDACYGGLAVTRALKPGSMRFLKDMLIRPARQVLTAGKADEVVADLGGPRPDHPVFTGHLLDALEGRAADSEGLLTANGVMAYVYQKVARDPESEQTPHFGYLDGDGDLIFSPAEIEKISPSNELRDEDVLVSVPAVLTNEGGMDSPTIVEKAKEYLSDERYRLKLHDLLAQQLRELLSLTAEDHFAVQGTWSQEEFLKRLDRYEKITAQLLQVQALVAFWGAPVHYGALAIPAKRLCGRFKSASGLSAWLSLRWYPALLLLYSGGIAAVAAEKYDNLSRLLQAVVADPEHSRYGGSSFVCAVTSISIPENAYY